jgi:hypothetical protein
MILFHINITSVQWRTAQILVRFFLSAVYMNNFPCWRAGINMSFWTRFLVKEIVDFRRTHAQTNKSCQGKLIKKTTTRLITLRLRLCLRCIVITRLMLLLMLALILHCNKDTLTQWEQRKHSHKSIKAFRLLIVWAAWCL